MIQRISKKKASSIISSYSPEGLFYTIDNGKYIGIDNSTEDAWVEEFDTLDECKRWLNGEFDVRGNEPAEADETP